MQQDQIFVVDVQEIKVAVDILVFNHFAGEVKLLLIKRKYQPFADSWAIPGGFFETKEDLLAAAGRELTEETSIELPKFITQVGAFGAVDRDPRRRIISIAYLGLLNSPLPQVKGDSDAAQANWFNIQDLPANLALDHQEIIQASIYKLRDLIRYSDAARHLLPEQFKLEEMENLFKTLLANEFTPQGFERYVNEWEYIKSIADSTYTYR